MKHDCMSAHSPRIELILRWQEWTESLHMCKSFNGGLRCLVLLRQRFLNSVQKSFQSFIIPACWLGHHKLKRRQKLILSKCDLDFLQGKRRAALVLKVTALLGLSKCPSWFPSWGTLALLLLLRYHLVFHPRFAAGIPTFWSSPYIFPVNQTRHIRKMMFLSLNLFIFIPKFTQITCFLNHT